jgi:uncharacterized protein (DUF1697 family)
MSTYVAMIRGINVTGYNIIPMERLRTLFSDCGFTDVRTYIQSGNVVFGATGSTASCVAAIQGKLERELGKPIAVILRTPDELGAIIAKNPFLKMKGVDVKRLAVSFLDKPPTKQRLAAVEAIESGNDQFRSAGREIYLYCPDGYGNSRLAGRLERTLGVKATARNWNSVRKLHEMATIKAN